MLHVHKAAAPGCTAKHGLPFCSSTWDHRHYAQWRKGTIPYSSASMKSLSRRAFINASLATGAALLATGRAWSADLAAVYREIERRHGESIARLQAGSASLRSPPRTTASRMAAG